jgi:hypothetical protein
MAQPQWRSTEEGVGGAPQQYNTFSVEPSVRQKWANLTRRSARPLFQPELPDFFLGTKYQNLKKYTKLPPTIANAHKI